MLISTLLTSICICLCVLKLQIYITVNWEMHSSQYNTANVYSATFNLCAGIQMFCCRDVKHHIPQKQNTSKQCKCGFFFCFCFRGKGSSGSEIYYDALNCYFIARIAVFLFNTNLKLNPVLCGLYKFMLIFIALGLNALGQLWMYF